jgi:restriction system protein
LLGVVAGEGADRGILIGTSGFTPDAVEFAAGKPLQLVDGNTLVNLAHPPAVTAVTRAPGRSTTAPMCPTCGKPMVWRTAQRGSMAGSQFWGCSTFPVCRGTRAA